MAPNREVNDIPEITKHLPSWAICCIEGNHVGRASAVGAIYLIGDAVSFGQSRYRGC